MTLALAFLVALYSTPVTSHDYDGEAFVGKIPLILGLKETDTLTFADGAFASSQCKKHGFTKSGYAVNGTTWSASQENDKGERMDWSGTRDGDTMTVSFVYTKANGKEYARRTFTAKKKL